LTDKEAEQTKGGETQTLRAMCVMRWIKHLTITVKNTSDRDLIGVGASIEFPYDGDQPLLPEIEFQAGLDPMVNIRERDFLLRPGETIELPLPAGWLKAVDTVEDMADTVTVFLFAAILIAICAFIALLSQKNYLNGFYQRRDQFQDLCLREKTDGSGWIIRSLGNGWSIRSLRSGWSIRSLMIVFVLVVLGSIFLLTAVLAKLRPTLTGARLQGADLSLVEGLVQSDFEGACGDANTKLPPGISLAPCK